MIRKKTCQRLLIVALLIASNSRADSQAAWQFSFPQDKGPIAPGVTAVTSDLIYDSKRGYGFEAAVPGGQPTLFSLQVPEGNYRVSVRFGDASAASDLAIKAESRRIMMPRVRLKAGETRTIEFVVNVHTPRIDDHTSVSISAREKIPAVRHWDDKLTLEFCGDHPAVSAVSITRDDAVKTVFLAGDSTVTDQPQEPWSAWGQAIPQFFGPTVAIANHAESGRTLKSFSREHRWAKLLSQLRPGDYVLIQFGHNDMKEKGNGVGAYTTFSESLRTYIADVRGKGGLPVLLTPMHRRKFDGDVVHPTFGDYPDATRKVAAELKVPLIDLQAMSKPLYEALGPETSKAMFVYFPANTFPGQDKELKDDTHVRAFGADQLARCVVQGIRDLKLPLAEDLRNDVPQFDPAKPNDPTKFDLPASPVGQAEVPEGR